jgi:hypothetical protein
MIKLLKTTLETSSRKQRNCEEFPIKAAAEQGSGALVSKALHNALTGQNQTLSEMNQVSLHGLYL